MQTKQEYQQLCKELYDMQVDIYKEEFIDRKPVLGNMWANINPPGAYNKLHCHPNSLFSGVYYVKSEPNSGRLKIHEPRPGKQLIIPSLQKRKTTTRFVEQCLFRTCSRKSSNVSVMVVA